MTVNVSMTSRTATVLTSVESASVDLEVGTVDPKVDARAAAIAPTAPPRAQHGSDVNGDVSAVLQTGAQLQRTTNHRKLTRR